MSTSTHPLGKVGADLLTLWARCAALKAVDLAGMKAEPRPFLQHLPLLGLHPARGEKEGKGDGGVGGERTCDT